MCSDCRCGPDRRFKFNKRSQLFIRMHNKTLTVVARSIDLALIFQLRRLGDDLKACSR